MDQQFLGKEKVGKLLRMFAIPCVLSLVIQALYNIVDQIFIGNAGYLPFGNTATGIVYPLTVIALAIGLCIGDGTAAAMSLNQGRNNTGDTHRSIGTGITLGAIISIVLMGISFIFATPILQFFGASGEAAIFLPDSLEYSTWIIAGFPFFIMACVLNPLVRTDGSPKFAMFAMAAGAILNIILDPIFLNVAHMGMTGAALATFIGQVVTFILHVVYLFRAKTFRLTWRSLIPDGKLFWTSVKLGISSLLNQLSIVVIAVVNNLVLSQYFVSTVQNAQGIMNVAFKIFGIMISIAIGVAAGAQPIVGYNYGAKKYDRVKRTLGLVLLVTLIVGVLATVLFEAVPDFLLSLFGYASENGTSPAEVAFGVNTFRIYLGLIAVSCLLKAVSIFFQAIGKPGKATLISLLRDVVFVVPLAILLPLITPNAFLWSAPLADVLTLVIAIVLLVVTLQQMGGATATDTHHVALQPSKPGLIITIARQHGSGGREIGQTLAKQLGVPFYDKEVAMLAAQETGIAADLVENVDHQNKMWYELYLSTDVNQNAIAAQDKALRQIADQGACVIVGRAADHVLRDYHPCKIFIGADTDFRIKRIMTQYGDDEKAAKASLRRSDQHRAKFYRAITGKDWGDRTNYNLLLDSSIGVAASVQTILAYLKNFPRQ